MRKLLDNLPALAVALFLVGGVAVIIGKMTDGGGSEAVAAVEMPSSLTAAAARGQLSFDENCAACHGANGAGTDQGPPLIHDIYNPGHHADAAFIRAAAQGVPRHHWSFGDMPPQPQVSEREVKDIIAFIREVQQENGITYRPHRM
ncbi:c-type cytochrome [Caenispirillum salinarum]|uniref:c-type cytochrome n=1 Tax=Caenispirillum salinarum TaxID=859058 RepID=UPI00385152E7